MRMMARTHCLLLLTLLVKYINYAECSVNDNENSIYHNEFAVHIPLGAKAADEIAAKYGYENFGQIGSLENFFLFRHRRLHKRSLNPAHEHHEELASDPQVTWVEQQVEKRRVKRDGLIYSEPDSKDEKKKTVEPSSSSSSSSSSSRLRRQFFPTPFHFGRFSFFKPAIRLQPIRRGTSRFPDPYFSHQWYLSEGAVGGFDMNVSAAWQDGYTGKGVVISILDDGIQHNHPDLKQNYDPLASTDINDNDADPMPRDNGDNKHGTRCAGEVASVAFNEYCGVGIAYNASVGGVRMLDGTVNDAVEARAISLNPDHIDIYSASWGPEDDGKTVDGPGPLAKRAFINGVIRGRHGKGSIFVWASGNGGRHTDNCNCDGYTNSIFTLSISSASQRGLKPWYLEECSSTLASTYSSGTPGLDHSVATSDMDGNLRPDRICTLDHTGTSASAPLAAGLCALALEANQDLTWRDMQHIVVRASRRDPLAKEEGWFRNAVGRYVSHKFGYGLMDAGAMVNLARRWRSVPPQHVCQTVINRTDLTIPTIRGSSIKAQITTDGCAGTSGEVRYLEHVQAVVSLRFLPRGNINIKLISPSGTSSTLLFERPRDVLSEKFDDWPFLSVHFWGEKAAGVWTLVVTNGGSRQSSHPGVLVHWQLILHGTNQNPEKILFSPSQFSPLTPTFTQVNDLRLKDIFSPKSSDTFYEDLSSQLKGRFRNSSNIIQEDYSSKPCHSECLGGCLGAGPQNCRDCRHFSLQGECLNSCPETTYGSESKECLPCHGSCAQCIGPRQTQCSSCPQKSFYVEHLGICVEKCPSGYYSENGLCLPCTSYCLECVSSEKCLECDHNLLLLNESCADRCPDGMFRNQNRCENCDSSCQTCVGGYSYECASCYQPFFMLNGRCIESCPQGTYGDDMTNSCRPCPMGCSSCNDKHCTSCERGWKIKAYDCVAFRPPTCSTNEYFENGKCTECHRSCLYCFGPNNNECLFCKRPLFLLNHKCVESCPEGYHSYQNNCFLCQHGCSSCNSFDECTECEERYFLHQNKCLSSCPQGYYNNNENRSCTPCNSACKSCDGPQADHCLSCPENLILLHNFCSSGCPSGYYEEDSRCRPCYHNCKTCNASGIFSCTSCQPYLTLDGGICLECPTGQYYNISQAKCDHCHESCLTCKGSHFNQCLSCQAPYSLHQETSTCQTCCKEGTDETKNGDCCECLPETGKCIGSVVTDKRRITMSLSSQSTQPKSGLSSSSSFVFYILLGTVAVFTLIIVVFQFKSKSSTRGSDSYNYQPLPTQASSSSNFSSYYKNSTKMSTLTFSNEDSEEEDDDDEAKELIKLVTNT